MILQSDIRYHIESRVGTGAFGAVYRATMVTTGGLEKSVALKVLHPELANELQIARLRDEARLLSMVKHRAIVHVYDLVEFEVGWTVVMELVEGLDLREICGTTSLSPRAAVELVGEVAAALHEAWVSDRGTGPLHLVHRDIKPANLVLNGAGEVKLLDFGIANAELPGREAQTQTRHVVGTLRYMAPERFEGICGPESDIYSLGIVLAEVLGARPPQLTPSVRAEMVAEVQERAGGAVADLVEAMVADDAGLRPGAQELARLCRELSPNLSGLPLVDWAMETVEELTEQRTTLNTSQEDPLCGSTLSIAMHPRRSNPQLLWMMAGGVLVAALAAFALGSVVTGSAFWVGTAVTQEKPYRIDRLTQLADVPPDIHGLSLSADGTTVAYTRENDLWVLPLGGQPTNLTRSVEGEYKGPVLSPDGKQAAAAIEERIEIRDLEGKLVRTIELDGRPVDWEDELLLIAGGTERTIYRLGEGQPVKMASGVNWSFARWAGDRVMISTGHALSWADASGTVEDAGVAAYSADVLRDGNLVFADTDGKRSRLFVGSDGEPVQQTELDGEVVTISVAADADRLAFVNQKVRTRFRLLDLRQGKVVSERILPLPRDQETADLLPDGKGLVFMEINENVTPGSRDTKVSYTVWRLSLDGEKEERLQQLSSVGWPSFGGVSGDQSAWYRYERLDDENGRFVTSSPIEPGEPELLFEMRRGLVHCVSVAPDAKSVALTDRNGFLHVLPTDAPITSVPEPVTPHGWHTQHWSPDGKVVYVIRRKDDQLAAYDPKRQKFRDLAKAVDDVYVAGVGQVILRRDKTLTWLDTTTLVESPFLEAKSDDVWIQFTPDGRQALLSEFLVEAEAWLGELER